ncbi:MAG: alpha/beta fold hydrolase [Promethearchaeota archaeon]
MESTVKTGNIEVPGASLRYRIEGEGIPTIIIGDTILMPRAFPQAMRDLFKMAFLDLRMYGPGTIPKGGLSLQSLADDVETFRKHLGWDKVVVIGYSIYGYISN